MHIEIFRGATPRGYPGGWFWHFKNKGRITADAEAFPSKTNAMRAAKAVVIAILKEVGKDKKYVVWGSTVMKDGSTKITWGV